MTAPDAMAAALVRLDAAAVEVQNEDARYGRSAAGKIAARAPGAFAAVATVVAATCCAPEAAGDPAVAFGAFAAWRAQARDAPFLLLMDQESLDVPVVEF